MSVGGVAAGFGKSHGLLVPNELAERERHVWTKDQKRLLDRCTNMLAKGGIALLMQCGNPDCKKAGPFQPQLLGDGSLQLQCEHADHLWMKAF